MSSRLKNTRIISILGYYGILYFSLALGMLITYYSGDFTLIELKTDFYTNNIVNALMILPMFSLAFYFLFIKPVSYFANLNRTNLPKISSILKTLSFLVLFTLIISFSFDASIYENIESSTKNVSALNSTSVYLNGIDRCGIHIEFGEEEDKVKIEHEFITVSSIKINSNVYFNQTHYVFPRNSNTSTLEKFLNNSYIGFFISVTPFIANYSDIPFINEVEYRKMGNLFFHNKDSISMNVDEGFLAFSILIHDKADLSEIQVLEILQDLVFGFSVFYNVVSIEEYAVSSMASGFASFLITFTLMIIYLVFLEDKTDFSDEERINKSFDSVFIGVIGFEFALEVLKMIVGPFFLEKYLIPVFFLGMKGGGFWALLIFSSGTIISTVVGLGVGITGAHLLSNFLADPYFKVNLYSNKTKIILYIFSIIFVGFPFLILLFVPLFLFITSTLNPLSVPFLYLFSGIYGMSPHYLPNFFDIIVEFVFGVSFYIIIERLIIFLKRKSEWLAKVL